MIETELDSVMQLLPVLEQEELFPIREVSRLTGVNPVTLRAWERRYGLIQPTRTESGHRLYALRDIETVRSILGWIERGVAVSKVGKLLARSRALAAPAPGTPASVASQEWADWQAQLRSAVGDFDEATLERLYGQIFSRYPLPVVFEDILLPLWQRMQLKHPAFGQASEWLFFDAFLQRRVHQRLESIRSASAQRIVLAALPGQCRALELLVAALLLDDGERALTVLPIGQALDELTLVCTKIKPQALILYSSRSPASDLPRRLSRLAMAVECPLMLAGEVADLLQASLEGSSIGCLGNEGRRMRQRLQQMLAGRLDT